MTERGEIEARLVELDGHLTSLSPQKLCEAGGQLIDLAKYLNPYDSNCVTKFGFTGGENLERFLLAAHKKLAEACASDSATPDHLRPLIHVVRAQNACALKWRTSVPAQRPNPPSPRRR